MKSAEQAVEKGNLREAAIQRDVHDGPVAFPQFTTRGLSPQSVDEFAETVSRVDFELPGEGGTTQSCDF